MRLLVYSQDFPPRVGGIETYTWELARRWAEAVEALVVLAPSHAEAARVDREAPFPVVRTRIPDDLLAVLGEAALRRVARAHAIDTVFLAQWQIGAGPLRMRDAGRLRRVGVAAHGRELLIRPLAGLPPAQAAMDRLRRSVLSRADALFPVSRYTAGLIGRLGVVNPGIHVVHNGVDPGRFRPVDGGGFRRRYELGVGPVILTIGRLVPRKGIDDVLRALPAVRARIPGALYVIAGAGPDRGRLAGLAAELGVEEGVRFIGKISDEEVVEAYGACDLFVTASRDDEPDVEGFGLVFLEAGACGKACVGTRAGGIPDAIVEGETGLLAPQGDPAALAAAMSRLLADPGLAAAMGAAGRRRALGEASWDRAAAAILGVLAGDRGEVARSP
jgi:phosphatidylinositol alpha-1,6-mannosyltransferase